MTQRQLPGYAPASFPPPSPRMGQTAAQVGISLSSVLAAALGVGTAWIGIRAGRREKEYYSALGYTVAVFGALVTLTSLAAITKVGSDVVRGV